MLVGVVHVKYLMNADVEMHKLSDSAGQTICLVSEVHCDIA